MRSRESGGWMRCGERKDGGSRKRWGHRSAGRQISQSAQVGGVEALCSARRRKAPALDAVSSSRRHCTARRAVWAAGARACRTPITAPHGAHDPALPRKHHSRSRLAAARPGKVTSRMSVMAARTRGRRTQTWQLMVPPHVPPCEPAFARGATPLPDRERRCRPSCRRAAKPCRYQSSNP